MTLGMAAAERGWLPDWAVRAGIRQLLQQRLREQQAASDPDPEGPWPGIWTPCGRGRSRSHPTPRTVSTTRCRPPSSGACSVRGSNTAAAGGLTV